MHRGHSRMCFSLLHSFPPCGDITDKLGCSRGEGQSVCYWPTPSVRTSKSSLKTTGQKHPSGKLGPPLQMTRFSSIYLFASHKGSHCSASWLEHTVEASEYVTLNAWWSSYLSLLRTVIPSVCLPVQQWHDFILRKERDEKNDLNNLELRPCPTINIYAEIKWPAHVSGLFRKLKLRYSNQAAVKCNVHEHLKIPII